MIGAGKSVLLSHVWVKLHSHVCREHKWQSQREELFSEFVAKSTICSLASYLKLRDEFQLILQRQCCQTNWNVLDIHSQALTTLHEAKLGRLLNLKWRCWGVLHTEHIACCHCLKDLSYNCCITHCCGRTKENNPWARSEPWRTQSVWGRLSYCSLLFTALLYSNGICDFRLLWQVNKAWSRSIVCVRCGCEECIRSEPRKERRG